MSRLSRLDSSSSSDDDDEPELILTALHAAHVQYQAMHAPQWGGSVPGRKYIHRDREAGHWRLYNDYFSDAPTYDATFFRRRFRMSRPLFLRIAHAVEEHDDYFVQKRDRIGRLGLSCLQKICAAYMMISYGVPADFMDQYFRIAESTIIESLRRLVKAIIEVFGDDFLRSPNEHDTARLLAIGERRGFPGMLGCLDCMHWTWRNCPAAWKGQYTGHMHEPTIILEAIASQDLWIWHAFFGLPGSHNDINVLHRSHLFAKLADGEAPKVDFTVNGHNYSMGYYLTDGIYPQWATFVKTIQAPLGNKRRYFAKAQEAIRKDVERAFGVLQSRFAIVRGPGRFWDKDTLREIMTACVIMHNMIIEDERDEDEDFQYDGVGTLVRPMPAEERNRTREFREFIQAHRNIRNRETHCQLQDDLIEHLWQRHGDMY